ncbi:MAG: L-lysine 2,3-aminomutase [Gammaproteobacteria bacterium]|jgi:EF-P beta-lysylation protein EpmB|nr:L-lysine 2,3-aminomutase [Gammaproteobacteria bacterium]
MSKKPWQKILAETINDLETLAKLLQVQPHELAHQSFPLKIPKAWIKKIEKGNAQDPLLRQILPVAEEVTNIPGFELDPLKEREASPIPGLLHKYQSRVLLIMTGICGINCRYCFRRNFPYEEHRTGQQQWQKALEYIAEHPEINEVVFSGGDPLLAPDNILAKLAQKIAEIHHVKTLRIHTRLPVFIPERCDKDFFQWFTGTRLKPVMVLHINHPNEIDTKLAKKMRSLKKRGISLLNQSVLLKGINDDAQTLKTLSEKLFFDCDILPYYIHALDKVKGAAHFEVEKSQALQLQQELQGLLAGYLVPKFVQEIPGENSKKGL